MWDKAKDAVSDAADKAKDLIDDKDDDIAKGIDTAADKADEMTGGKFSEHIDKGADMAKDAVDKMDGKEDIPNTVTIRPAMTQPWWVQTATK